MKSNVFFLGKGGVGKTTLSAAFALALAREGRRVLVVSLDPAHNLGDALAIKLADKPMPVETGLDAMEIDLQAWVTRYLEDNRKQLSSLYGYTSTLNLDSFFSIMKYSPGIEEYAVLWAIEHIQCNLAPEYDTVVYDTPPTALSLRFLAMPSISTLWIAELAKLRARILEKRGTIARLNPQSPVASSCVDKNDDSVYGKLGSLRTRLATLEGLFTRQSFVAVVINPDSLSVSEALRIREELTRIGMPLDSVCLNKRGVSDAPWELDPGLSGPEVLEFNFERKGLHSRKDLDLESMKMLVKKYLESSGGTIR